MAQKEMRVMMKGAAILTLASFIAKLLSAVYRVPFQNLVGDEGFYVYQQVYPIYGLAMTLALTGLPQFISKCVAEKSFPEQEREHALQKILSLMLLLGIVLWGCVFLGSGIIAKLMGDASLKSLIQVVSFTFLLMPGLSFYRGYFQGQLQMVPTAVSQVLEQVVRVGLILTAAFFFRRLSWNIYQTGTLAMAGAVAGGIFALGILFYYDRKFGGDDLALQDFLQLKKPDKSLFRRFIVEGGLVSIYSGYLILFQLVDSFFVKNCLVYSGISEQAARIEKGVYDRGQPIVQLGLVVATALSATFLPTLTKHLAKKNHKQFVTTTHMYLRISTTLAVAATVGLAMLMPFINFALFKDLAGNLTLIVFVLSVGLMAEIQAYQSITQSLNRFRQPLRGAVYGLLVKFAATGVFTYFLGTVGASLATVAGLLVALVYLIRGTSKDLNIFWKENHFFTKLCLCLGIMVLVLVCIYGAANLLGVFDQRLQAFLWALAGVVLGGTAFIGTAVGCRLFTIREWLMFPKGDKILRLMKRGK